MERKQRAEAEAKEAREMVKSLQGAIEGAEAEKIAGLQEELMMSQQVCEGLQGRKADLEEKVRTLEKETTKLQEVSAEKDGMEVSFRQQINQLEDELANVKLAHNSDQLAIAALQQQVVELEKEVGNRQKSFESKEASEAELQVLSADLEKQLLTSKAQLDEALSEQLALQRALERQSGIEVDLRTEAGNLKSALEEAVERHRKDEEALAGSQSQVVALERDAAESEAEISSLRASCAELERQVKVLEDMSAAQDESQQRQLAEEILLQSKLQEVSAQLASATMAEEMQQELISRLQGTLSTSEIDLSQSRTHLAAQEAVKLRLQENLEHLRVETTQNQKVIRELRSQLNKSEDELSVANTAYQTLQSMEAELRSEIAQQDRCLSESRGELKVQEQPVRYSWNSFFLCVKLFILWLSYT